MDDSGYDENAVLFFEETGPLGNAYSLYTIKDFKDGRDTLIIPSEVNGKPVVEIAAHAAAFRHIKNLYIPSSINCIGEYAFKCREFEYVEIDGVKTIGKRAFENCDYKNIVFCEGVKHIGECAFYSNNIQELVLPNSLETIEDGAFAYSLALKHITFGDHLTKIGSSAFETCIGIEELSFPNSLLQIGDYAFEDCKKLEYVKFGSQIKVNKDKVFANCHNLKGFAD